MPGPSRAATSADYAAAAAASSYPSYSSSRPTTSSSSSALPPFIATSTVVNAELEATMELLTRDFINTWLNYIAYDPQPGLEIQSALRHICQRLERRLRKVDWVELLLCDTPDLLQTHLQVYRECQRQARIPSQSAGLTVAELYFLRRPHAALLNDECQRRYLESISACLCDQLLLPPRERQSAILRSFMIELVTGFLLIVVDKMSDSDFIYDSLLTVLISSDQQAAKDANLQIPRLPGRRRTPKQKERRDLQIVSTSVATASGSPSINIIPASPIASTVTANDGNSIFPAATDPLLGDTTISPNGENGRRSLTPVVSSLTAAVKSLNLAAATTASSSPSVSSAATASSSVSSAATASSPSSSVAAAAAKESSSPLSLSTTMTTTATRSAENIIENSAAGTVGEESNNNDNNNYDNGTANQPPPLPPRGESSRLLPTEGIGAKHDYWDSMNNTNSSNNDNNTNSSNNDNNDNDNNLTGKAKNSLKTQQQQITPLESLINQEPPSKHQLQRSGLWRRQRSNSDQSTHKNSLSPLKSTVSKLIGGVSSSKPIEINQDASQSKGKSSSSSSGIGGGGGGGNGNAQRTRQRLFSHSKRPSLNFQPLSLAISRKHSAILLLTPEGSTAAEAAAAAASSSSSSSSSSATELQSTELLQSTLLADDASKQQRLSEPPPSTSNNWPQSVPPYATLSRGSGIRSSATKTTTKTSLISPQPLPASSSSAKDQRSPQHRRRHSSHHHSRQLIRQKQKQQSGGNDSNHNCHKKNMSNNMSNNKNNEDNDDGNESDDEENFEDDSLATCVDGTANGEYDPTSLAYYWPSALRWDSLQASWSRLTGLLSSTIKRLRSPLPAQLGPMECWRYRQHLLDDRWLRLVETLFDLRQNCYWLWSSFLLLIRPFLWVIFGPILRQLILQDIVYEWVLSEHRIAVYIRSAREVLWPAGVWAAAAPPKTPDQRRLTRLALEAEIRKILQPLVGVALGERVMEEGLQLLLDSLGDPVVTRRLIVEILELIGDRIQLGPTILE